MDDKITLHPLAEFRDVPWSGIDPDAFGRTWSVARGGYGSDVNTWFLVVHGPDTIHAWELPAPIGSAFQAIKANARATLKRQIITLLGSN